MIFPEKQDSEVLVGIPFIVCILKLYVYESVGKNIFCIGDMQWHVGMLPVPSFFTVRNHTRDIIFCGFHEFKDKSELSTVYKDLMKYGGIKIAPSSRYVSEYTDFDDTSHGWGVVVYIIKQSTSEKYGWDYISENYIYDKRYIFTIEELERMKYIVNYPYNQPIRHDDRGRQCDCDSIAEP